MPRTFRSIKSPMHGRPRSSDMVECMPRGLFSAKYTSESSSTTLAPSTRTTAT
ncbi:Uncharacterised protein [Mycobacterium tuberculosis]|uniref:Uncharacterized protein n=1 Tax=Mycobacterium tuberculosis TaxID=1773 RepID=A0A916LAS6_MYCTX|nr:Uncharacterised protein [Mycobacterium tuberculosis]COY68815.1 Uncharacterised protein [Mycobacterium tuberculosis]